MNDFVDVQIMLGHEGFPTIRTAVVPHTGMDFLVLNQIVLTVETFTALFAAIQAFTVLMDFHMRREGVLRSKVLGALRTLEWAFP